MRTNTLIYMTDIIKNLFDWRVKVQFDQLSNLYTITNRSLVVFSGTKEECRAFLSAHTVTSLVGGMEMLVESASAEKG